MSCLEVTCANRAEECPEPELLRPAADILSANGCPSVPQPVVREAGDHTHGKRLIRYASLSTLSS